MVEAREIEGAAGIDKPVAASSDPKLDQLLALVKTQGDLVKTQGDQIREMRERIDASDEPDDPEVDWYVKQGLTVEQVELGKAALNASHRIAKQQARKAATTMAGQVQIEIERGRAETAQHIDRAVAKAAFFGGLAALCPGHRALDDNPQFTAWMQSHGLLGAMSQAWRDGDAGAAAAIYRQYLDEAAGDDTGGLQLPPGQFRRPPPGAAPPRGDTRPRYTGSQLTRFFDLCGRGQHPLGWQELEQEYVQAQREGRVDYSA
jgi:hypothetical protein